MKRSIIFSLVCILLSTWNTYAQNPEMLKVAVFDPASSTGSSIDEGTTIAVREIISSVFVNSGEYSIVERSLLDKVMHEAKFSNSDVVNDTQATELGKLAGADKVVLSVLTKIGGKNMLSVKLIDVETATVEKQQAKIIAETEFVDQIEPLTLALLGKTVAPKTAAPPRSAQQVVANVRVRPANTAVQNKALPSSDRSPAARSVMNLINQSLGGSANRYKTDEERLAQAKTSGEIKELIKFSTRPVLSPPRIDEKQVLFFCLGETNKGGDDPLYLFVDGTMAGVGTAHRGLVAIVQNDDSSHQITVWRKSSKVYSSRVDFSPQKQYRLMWDGKTMRLH